MRDLRLVGVTDDGTRLVLTGAGEHFALPIDAALRAALRQDSGHHVIPGHHDDRPMSPVEVQALIRGGADAEEAAQRAGWTVEKVRRYEGPILAERAHVARIATTSRLRPRGPASGSPTLMDRVTRRLSERGISVDDADWDSWRSDDAQWVVEIHFTDGDTARHGSWSFDKTSHALHPLDHEAALLSEDDPDLIDSLTEGQGHRSAPAAAAHTVLPARPDRVYVDEASDLMATLRSSSRAASRRRAARRPETSGDSLFPAAPTPIVTEPPAAQAEPTAAPAPAPAVPAPLNDEARPLHQTAETPDTATSGAVSPVEADSPEVPEAIEAAPVTAELPGADTPDAVAAAPALTELAAAPSPEVLEAAPAPAALPAVEATPVPAADRTATVGSREPQADEQIIDAVIVEDAGAHPSSTAAPHDANPETTGSRGAEGRARDFEDAADADTDHVTPSQGQVQVKAADASLQHTDSPQTDSEPTLSVHGDSASDSSGAVPHITAGRSIDAAPAPEGPQAEEFQAEEFSVSSRSSADAVEAPTAPAVSAGDGAVPGPRDTTLPGESPALDTGEVDDAPAASDVPTGVTHVEPALSPELEPAGSAQDAVIEAVTDITTTPGGDQARGSSEVLEASAESTNPGHEEPPLPFDVAGDRDAKKPVTADARPDALPEVKTDSRPVSEGTADAAPSAPARPDEADLETPAPSGRRRRRSGGNRGSQAAPPAPSASVTPAEAAPSTARVPKPAPPTAAPAQQQESPKPAAKKTTRSSSRRKGRASVPAWDDIMFGSKPGSDTDE